MPFGSMTFGMSTSSTTTTTPCAFQNMHTITNYYSFWKRITIMTNEDKYRYCEHSVFGVGSAQLIKPRKSPNNDLWMVSFQSQGNAKWFYCTKHFNFKDEIEFIDEARATGLYKEGRRSPKKKRTKSVQEDPKNLSDLLDSLFPT
jgi:hypothetical protein